MKILFLSHHWANNSHHSQYSGFQRLVVYAARQHEVTLVTWGKEKASYVDEHGIRVVTVKGGGKDLLFQKRMRISLMGRRMADEFDAVHALYEDCTFFLKKGSFTVTFHVLPGIAVYKELKQQGFLFLKYHVLQKRAMRRARHIVVVSTNLLEKVPEKHRGKARFLPHGIDTEFWDPALSERKAEEAVPAEAKGKFVALCVGAHGLDREMMAKLIAANPTARWVMVGIKERLEGYSQVEYLRGISDERLRDLYAEANVMVRPLIFATANNSVLEAMSMGKTILASRIPGITDYLNDANCIFLDTMKDLSLQRVLSGKMDPGSVRGYAVREFSWQRVLNEYLQLYNQKS